MTCVIVFDALGKATAEMDAFASFEATVVWVDNEAQERNAFADGAGLGTFVDGEV